jgi:Domain of unknown function (DUF6259)
MRRICILLLLLIASGVSFIRPQPSFAQAIYFVDSDPKMIVLGNSFYEVGIHKANGSIAYITDKATGQHISEGSRYGCLWGAYGMHANYVGGCSYTVGATSAFSYIWSAADARLSLRYAPDLARTTHATALVTLTASPDRWFDLQLRLENHLGGTLDYVLFPSDLVFREADLQAVYLPVSPGIVLKPAFFAQNRSYVAAYPGDFFADFMALTSGSGSISIYALYDEGAGIRPLVLGFNHDDGYLQDSSYYYHSFGARSPDGGIWISPRVRVRIGQPVTESIQAYRSDNGIAQFRSLASKAGARYTQIVQSPLLKADVTQLAIPFAQYAALLSHVPAPGILHLLAFQPGGFDENHPDMLPPAAAWGSSADMAEMVHQAQAMGFLVMPYINPTWWNDQSPTLQTIISTGQLTNVAALDSLSIPRYEVYGPHTGYVVSPYAPLVRQRIGQLMSDITGSISSDLVFEDQIGARTWIFDYSAFSPNPTAYAQGWLEHTRTYSNTLLMTEGGMDRLAETELGFHGGVLLAERLLQTEGRWGNGTWEPFPILPLMLRDKVLLYQHNLAPESFTVNKATLAWNMAFGFMLSYDLGWTNFGGGVADPWLAVVTAFQREVFSRYASERLLSYTDMGDAATRSVFEHVVVITNWSSTTPYGVGSYEIPPSGAMVTSEDGSLIAGVFSSYNGHPLRTGDHYLIEQHSADAITVRQPMGDDTELTIRNPLGWKIADEPAVSAVSVDGIPLGPVASSATADGVTFVYQHQIAGVAVSYYQIALVQGTRIFMPLVQHPGNL